MSNKYLDLEGLTSYNNKVEQRYINKESTVTDVEIYSLFNNPENIPEEEQNEFLESVNKIDEKIDDLKEHLNDLEDGAEGTITGRLSESINGIFNSQYNLSTNIVSGGISSSGGDYNGDASYQQRTARFDKRVKYTDSVRITSVNGYTFKVVTYPNAETFTGVESTDMLTDYVYTPKNGEYVRMAFTGTDILNNLDKYTFKSLNDRVGDAEEALSDVEEIKQKIPEIISDVEGIFNSQYNLSTNIVSGGISSSGGDYNGDASYQQRTARFDKRKKYTDGVRIMAEYGYTFKVVTYPNAETFTGVTSTEMLSEYVYTPKNGEYIRMAFTGPDILNNLDKYTFKSLNDRVSDAEKDIKNIGVDTNLIGNDMEEYYPCDIKAGSSVCISTIDGTLYPEHSESICFFDKNKKRVSLFTAILSGTNKRVVIPSQEHDVAFIRWGANPKIPCQLNIGTDIKPYVPYTDFGTNKIYSEQKDTARSVLCNSREDGMKKRSGMGNTSFTRFGNTISILNPYSDASHRYKGQIHCHTTNSDGTFSPQEIVRRYSEVGYDFVTITDHNYITPQPSNMYGMTWLCDSTEDTNNITSAQHCNIFNIKNLVNRINMYDNTNDMNTIYKEYVLKQGAVVMYNHPEDPVVYVTNSDIDAMEKCMMFVEIHNSWDAVYMGEVSSYSSLPTVAEYRDMYTVKDTGKKYINDSTDGVRWVETYRKPVEPDRGFSRFLDTGAKVFGTAVDDCHNGAIFNKGWIQVFAENKGAATLMDAMCKGNFYASSGVEFSSISVADGTISLNVENGSSAVTTFYGFGNEVLATVEGANPQYDILGHEGYVRAETKIGRQKAWTQAIWICDVKTVYSW